MLKKTFANLDITFIFNTDTSYKTVPKNNVNSN